MSQLLVVAMMLLLGFVTSNGSAWQIFPLPAPCPVEGLRTGKPRPLVWTACPGNCQCSSTDVQLWCPGPDMPQLADADAMDVETMVVEGAGIHRLQAHYFRGLKHLLSLTLSKGRISEIAEYAFLDLLLLRHLDLSNNKIREIPVDAFAYNENLRFLVLDGNPLHVPSSSPLLLSASLGSLSIERCGITSVNSVTFAGCPVLYEIFMEDNPLTEAPREAIRGLRRLCSINFDLAIDDHATGTEEFNAATVVQSATGFDFSRIQTSTDAVDPNADILGQSTTGSNFEQVLLVIAEALVVVVVLTGAYKIWSTVACPCKKIHEVVPQESNTNRINKANNNEETETPASLDTEIQDDHMVDERDGYHIINEEEQHPPEHGYPGYVYNGVDCSSSSPRECDPYNENVGLYPPPTKRRRPTDSLPLPPTEEDNGRERLLSLHESVGTSTSDLRTSLISDVVIV